VHLNTLIKESFPQTERKSYQRFSASNTHYSAEIPAAGVLACCREIYEVYNETARQFEE